MTRQGARWLVSGIVCLGMIVRGYALTAKSIWFDEAFTWRLIQFSWREVIARAATDVHPPLYYLGLKIWSIVFGSSLLSLRSFSLVMAGLTIVALYGLVALMWRSRRSGLLAAALLAVSGWYIPFASEARMYTLGTFLAVLSAWILFKAVHAPRARLGWWLGYALCATALIYTHYYGLFTVAAEVIWVLGYILVATRGRIGEIIQSPTILLAGLSWALIVALFSPWLPVLLRQTTQVRALFWIATVTRWAAPDTIYQMFIPGGAMMFVLLPLLVCIGTAVWLVLAPAARRRHTIGAAWLTVLAVAVPFGVSLAVSWLGKPVYQDRYLVFTFPFLLAGVAAGIMLLPGRWTRRVITTVVIISFIGLAWRYYSELDVVHKPGLQAAVRSLFKQRHDGEPIVVSSPFIFFGVDYYATEEFSTPALAKLARASPELLHFAGGPVLKPDDRVGPDFFAATHASTVWIIDTSGFGESELIPPSPWQRTKHEAYPEVFDFQGEIFVNKYERTTPLR